MCKEKGGGGGGRERGMLTPGFELRYFNPDEQEYHVLMYSAISEYG
jgi:hypothetical protein